MKKLIMLAVCCICIGLCRNVNAEDETGYIFSLKNNEISLFSLPQEGVIPLGDGLYLADSLDSVYEFVCEDDIAEIFPDYKFELFDADYPQTTSDTSIGGQWYLDAVKAEASRRTGVFGDGVRIAVLDSGLNITHPDLNSSRILQGYNCISGSEDLDDISDNQGHGTKVAGIIAAQTDNQLDIAGIASSSYIIPIKITDNNEIKLSSIYLGINTAIDCGCDIINMSWGGPMSDADTIAKVQSWIDKAVDMGIIVIAAVGNDGEATINYPAGLENVIGVGAVNNNLTAASFSQHNESVFVTAPGVSILSLSNISGTVSGSGTSFSTPQITAAAALVKELKPEYTSEEFKQLIKDTSTDLGDAGYDEYYGYGLINIENIIEKLSDALPELKISQGMNNNIRRIHIHNNTEDDITADCYFSEFTDGRLNNIYSLRDVNINTGVVNIDVTDECKAVYVWNKRMRPYANKVIINNS